MEKVLELRENTEKNIMEEFALIQRDLIKEKMIFSNLNKEYDSLKEAGIGAKDIYSLIHHDLYKRSIEEKIEKQEETIYSKTIELENIRLCLVDAQKDRKIMENLKEKDFNTYVENLKCIEQKELDEIAILRFKEAQ